MYRIDNSSAAATLPTPSSPGTAGYYTNGDVGAGILPTIVDADQLNLIQEELMSILTAAGIAPNKTAYNQVLLSIEALIGSSLSSTALLKANNLSDLVSKQTSRVNLGVRDVLQANTTYYVSTAGNDSNNGSSGSPWLTIQHAINFLLTSIDLAGYSATISVADGTYTGGVVVNYPFTGAGSVTLQGNITTPANCTISTTAADCIALKNGANLNVLGFTLKTNTSGNGISCIDMAICTITGKMVFGAMASGGNHMNCGRMSEIKIGTTSYTISGGASSHIYAIENSHINIFGGITVNVTVSSAPVFSIFCAAATCTSMDVGGFVFAGAATGTRYASTQNAVINTNAAGASYFPGSVAGFTTTGGQYT